MRAALTIQRALLKERAFQGEKSLRKLRDRHEFGGNGDYRWRATPTADQRIHTLTTGKDADLVMLRTELKNVMPLNNAYGAIVTRHGNEQRRDRDGSAGRIEKQRGRLVGVDLAAHRKRIAASRELGRPLGACAGRYRLTGPGP